jgi:hypothetical protein
MRVDGTVYVLLTPDQIDRAQPGDQASQGGDRAHPDAQARPGADPSLHRLVDEQREMIDWLKREVERKDTILMQMAQRIPELEPATNASQEPRQSPQKPSENQGNGMTHPEDGGADKRSWWKRFFGVE